MKEKRSSDEKVHHGIVWAGVRYTQMRPCTRGGNDYLYIRTRKWAE